MLKSELAARIAEKHGLFQRDADAAVAAILDTIANALAQSERVELRDFGVFAVRSYEARQGRNPRTGAAVDVEESDRVHFRMSTAMHRRLNPDGPAPR